MVVGRVRFPAQFLIKPQQMKKAILISSVLFAGIVIINLAAWQII